MGADSSTLMWNRVSDQDGRKIWTFKDSTWWSWLNISPQKDNCKVSDLTSKTSFKLQAKPFCFSNLISNTDCPHRRLQVIRSDLLRPDMTTLYWPSCKGYCGDKAGVSLCAGDSALQHESMIRGKTEIHDLTILTLVLSSCGVELCYTGQTQPLNKPMNIFSSFTPEKNILLEPSPARCSHSK